MITKDPIVAFTAFLDGHVIEYHRPGIDYDYEDNEIEWKEINSYSNLYIFKNYHATSDENVTQFRITKDGEV